MMGYGVGSFRAAITPEVGPNANVAHNSYLSVLVEEGIVGLVLYTTMIASVFFSILRLPNPERLFALILMATLTMAMLPLSWEDEKQVWFVTAWLVGFSTPMLVRQKLTLERGSADPAMWEPSVVARPHPPRHVGGRLGTGPRR
jgi:O-antigen ligase